MGGTPPPRHGAPWIGGTLGYPMAPTVGGCIQPFAPPILGTGPIDFETMSIRFRINNKDKEKFNTIYTTPVFTLWRVSTRERETGQSLVGTMKSLSFALKPVSAWESRSGFPVSWGVAHGNCSGSLSSRPILTRFEVLSSAWNRLSSRGIQSSRRWLSSLVFGRQSVALTAVCGELSWRWLAPRPLWSRSLWACVRSVVLASRACA